jgi:DNA-binding transcriptional LysR family regulator
MNLSSVDLNLLVVLDALLALRSTTLAGRRLGLSQPATSHALARLRDLLGDPLLVRSGKGLVPTPFAERLAPRLRDALEALGQTLDASDGFDPRQARRLFRVGMSDYEGSLIVPSLAAYLQREAPQLDLFIKTSSMNSIAALLEGELDLALMPVAHGKLPPQLRSESLVDERLVCLLRKDHPLAGKRMTLDRFCALGHVLVAPVGSDRRGPVDDALAERGRSRRVAVTVPHASMAPLVVAQTDYVVTLAARFAQRAASELGLRRVEPPVVVPNLRIGMVWHARHDADRAHQFLREAITSVTR